MNAHTTQALAPAPPEKNYYQITGIPSSDISIGTNLIITDNAAIPPGDNTITASLTKESKPECKINHRFDNKALLAYEWDRSRVALDLDGVGLDWDGFTEFEQIKLEYKLKFSSEKTKKERCRYPSRWQGLIGSGYNELYLRENDTVWEEIKEIRKDLKKKINNYF